MSFDELVTALRHDGDPLLSDALHELIGYAFCDRELQALLLSDPRTAARRFGLKGNDLRAAESVTGARSLAEYAVKLEQAFAGIKHSGRVAVRGPKKDGTQRARKAS